jgi:hypothetical protein
MAFATSNLAAHSAGSTRTVTGNWSCTAGDAPGTIVIGSSSVIAYDFDPASTTSPSEKPLVTASTSGNQTTLTVYHHQTVTTGKFRIEY